MDKEDFVKKAPQYYALGIAIALSKTGQSPQTIESLDDAFGNDDDYYFQKQAPVDHGMTILYEANVVDRILDDFGPTIYQPKEDIEIWIRDIAAEQFQVFKKYNALGSITWIRRAIKSVNEHYDQLGIAPEDFSETAFEEQWTPIPLDRADDKLNIAIKSIEKAVEVISGDNGYAANVPGEREYVLYNLKNITSIFKEHSHVYWIQLRTFALEPLASVIKRFGAAATGIVAKAARDAIFEWLKAHFAKGLDWFSS